MTAATDFFYDPIVEEIRKTRADLMEESKGDLHAAAVAMRKFSKRYQKRDKTAKFDLSEK